MLCRPCAWTKYQVCDRASRYGSSTVAAGRVSEWVLCGATLKGTVLPVKFHLVECPIQRPLSGFSFALARKEG
jgi:hypothetical protein